MRNLVCRLVRIASLCLVTLAPLAASAQQAMEESSEQATTRYKASIQAADKRVHELRAALESPAQPLDAASYYVILMDYFKTALWLVYDAKIAANQDSSFGSDLETSNSNLSSLVGLGYLPEWPANPLISWQPIRVLSPSDSYSAGNLVFDLCGQDMASTIDGEQVQVSFQLYIYGYDPNAKYLGVDVVDGNSFSVPPRGAVFGSGMHMETVAEREKRVARVKKWLEEHPEDAPAASPESEG